ncbi:uncharacterized protein involved in response to NO [Constrictibacter sp. MBR-5]|jgi:uncharacterized protein involved in response to NO|uniref:NnrS family protein n=1 Tax=Constrictibacter sp. MBR-5 TaxID=3156467 RepID=UPI0033930663
MTHTVQTGAVSPDADRRLPPPVFCLGFRPFFLLGAIWALVAIALWLAALSGALAIGGPYGALGWHAHEMIYGFAAAILAGFLLTAVPGWTMQPKLGAGGLAALAALWVAGRFVMASADIVGVPAAAAIDLLFLVLVLARTASQIVASRNWRSLPIAAAPAVLLGGNLLFHLGAAGFVQTSGLENRLGIAVYVFLVATIGGRIIPTFTRNWLKKRAAAGTMPPDASRFDVGVVLVTLATLVLWVSSPEGPILAATATVAASGHLARLLRWKGLRTGSEPLVWILHVAYAWMPVSFCLVAAAAYDPVTVPGSAVVHALTAGVITTMMFAIMTRATLGHTGRPLIADRWTTAAYVMIVGAAVCRVSAALLDSLYMHLLTCSGLLWVSAFFIYLASYGPKLLGEPWAVSAAGAPAAAPPS